MLANYHKHSVHTNYTLDQKEDCFDFHVVICHTSHCKTMCIKQRSIYSNEKSKCFMTFNKNTKNINNDFLNSSLNTKER